MEGRIEGPDTNANTNTTHEYGDFDWRFFKMEGGSEGGLSSVAGVVTSLETDTGG